MESIIYVIKYNKYILDKIFDISFKLNDDIEKYFAIKKDIMTKDSSNFNLVYQPKISNKYKYINSCEVLSRWSNKSIGESTQDEIISKFAINISIKSILNCDFSNEIYKLVRRYNINVKNVYKRLYY